MRFFVNALTRVRVAALVLVFSLFAPVVARADPAKDVVAVDVGGDVTGVDASRLRAAIGDELGAVAVPVDDPRASHARGTLVVAIERATGKLVVSFRDQRGPITRTVDVPSDAAATERTIVLLAGNLARDEAGELSAELRKTQPPAPPASSASTQTTSEDDYNAAMLERMRATLADATGDLRTLRTVAGWSVFGLGVASLGTGAYLLTQGHPADAMSFFQGGFFAPLVASILLPNGRLDEIGRYYTQDVATKRPRAMVLDDVEGVWLSAARREHRQRRVMGWLEAGSGAALIGLDIAFSIAAHNEGTAASSNAAVYSTFYSMSAVFLTWGVYTLVTDGPVESSLHAYERSSGRAVWSRDGEEVTPTVSLVPGGGAVGLSGRF